MLTWHCIVVKNSNCLAIHPRFELWIHVSFWHLSVFSICEIRIIVIYFTEVFWIFNGDKCQLLNHCPSYLKWYNVLAVSIVVMVIMFVYCVCVSSTIKTCPWGEDVFVCFVYWCVLNAYNDVCLTCNKHSVNIVEWMIVDFSGQFD